MQIHKAGLNRSSTLVSDRKQDLYGDTQRIIYN